MEDISKVTGKNFENTIREYLKQGRDKLENDLTGTREAMRIIAGEKTRDFIKCLLHIDWHNIEVFTVNGAILVQTEKLLMSYLMHCLDKPLKSMNFIKQVSSLL